MCFCCFLCRSSVFSFSYFDSQTAAAAVSTGAAAAAAIAIAAAATATASTKLYVSRNGCGQPPIQVSVLCMRVNASSCVEGRGIIRRRLALDASQ